MSDHLSSVRADAPTSLGQAMLLAKQEYLATTFTLTPYDEKILQSWTYYGLPMYEIGGGSSVATISGTFTTPIPTSRSSFQTT